MNLALALAFSVLGSVGSVLAAGALLIGYNRASRAIPLLVSYATGALLGASLIAMLPAALARQGDEAVFATVLAGLVAFFALERMMLWRHAHGAHHEQRDASRELILIGDAVHNLMDGFAIGSAFAEGGPLGISTGLAVIAHEIAQEVGDLAILLDGGLDRRRALSYNIASSATTIPAAAIAFVAASFANIVIPFALAIAAASFLYIALADLVPRHHERRSVRSLPADVALIAAGVGTIAVLHAAA